MSITCCQNSIFKILWNGPYSVSPSCAGSGTIEDFKNATSIGNDYDGSGFCFWDIINVVVTYGVDIIFETSGPVGNQCCPPIYDNIGSGSGILVHIIKEGGEAVCNATFFAQYTCVESPIPKIRPKGVCFPNC